MFSHILVPLNRSEEAARAIEPVLSLAETYGAPMTLLMVMFRAPLSYLREDALFDRSFEQHGWQYLDETCATRMRGTAVPVERVVKLGTAAEGILAYPKWEAAICPAPQEAPCQGGKSYA